MSRKRKKQPEGVPHEVLAEGSGPSSVDQLAEAAADVLDLEAQLNDIEADDHEALEAHVVNVLEQEMVFDPSDADASAEAIRAEAEAELGEPAPEEVEVEADEDDDLGAALPTTAASMDDRQLKSLVEALVFASDKPITLQRLRQLTRISDTRRLEQVLSDLATDYADRGVSLQQVSGGYLFRTNTQYSVWVQQLIAGRPVRLSRAQLETLAIIAYRQPITRPEVDEIRGVDSSATLRLLMDRSLIRILGRKEEVGRPILYGTTKEFLDFFSLGDLRELPTLREYSELTAESRKLMTDELGGDVMARHMAEARAANDTGMEAVSEGAPRMEARSWGRSGANLEQREADEMTSIDAPIDDGDVAPAMTSPAMTSVEADVPSVEGEASLPSDDVDVAPAMTSVDAHVGGDLAPAAMHTDNVEVEPMTSAEADVGSDADDKAPAMTWVEANVASDDVDMAPAMASVEADVDMAPVGSDEVDNAPAMTWVEANVATDDVDMAPAMTSVEAHVGSDDVDTAPAMTWVEAEVPDVDMAPAATDVPAEDVDMAPQSVAHTDVVADLRTDEAADGDDAAKEPSTD